MNRLREELAKLKMALRQGFTLIDETCAKHSSALQGLQSFAGAEIGASQRVHETLQLSHQMGILQHRTLELKKNTSWEKQSIEDDLTKSQVKFQGGSQVSGQDRVIAQLSQQVQELSQNPLWHEMQKTTAEVQQFKEKGSAMRDIENRLRAPPHSTFGGEGAQHSPQTSPTNQGRSQAAYIFSALKNAFHTDLKSHFRTKT